MKKTISLLLAVFMVLGMLPMTVLAEEAAACTHAATTETVADNGDGTHNKTVVCDDCGETVALDTILIDFKSDFADASSQTFWESLPTATLANGGETKRVGSVYNGVLEEGSADAFRSLDSWLAENKDWSFDDTTVKHVTGKSGQKLYFNTDDDTLWGLSHNGYFIAMEDGRSSLGLTVKVEEAGLYDLSAAFVLSNSSSKDYDSGVDANNKQLADAGGCKNIHVIVNGETVKTGIDTVGATALTDIEIGQVYLNEGENSVVFFIATNYWNQTNSAYRSNVNLSSMTLEQRSAAEECVIEEEITFNEGSKTHTVALACACGAAELAAPEIRAVAMDFKAIAKEMAKQEFWAALPSATTGNGVEVRYVGGAYGTSMTAEQSAAYDAMNAWLSETYGWSIDDAFETFKDSDGGRLFISDSDDIAWGFSHNSYYTAFAADTRDSFGVVLNAPKAGWYRVDMNLSLSTSSSVDNAVSNGGGAYMDISINDELFCAHLGNVGANAVVSHELGAVWLNEGENTLRMEQVGNYWNQTNSAYRCNFNMVDLSLTMVGAYVLPGGTVTVDANDYVASDVVLSADTHTVVVSGAVTEAAIDENGDLTVTAGEEEGTGSVIVSTVATDEAEAAEVLTVSINVVTAMEYDCTDADANGLCDVCGGKIGECAHKNTTAEITSNGNETHTTQVTCDLCGEKTLAEETDLNTIKVDFADFADQAAQQDFWAQLPDETTVSGAAVKRIGVTYDTEVDDAMTAEEDAAYDALRAWQEDTLHWSFDESLMNIKHEYGNMIFLANDAVLKWGVLHHSYFFNMTDYRSDMALTVIADKAGYYQLDMSYVPQGSTATDYPGYALIGAGGGYVDIYVNGELAVDNFSFKCENTKNNQLHAADLATVYLQAGGNSVVIRKAANYHGTSSGAYTGRANAAITDLTFTEIDTPNLKNGTVIVAAADVTGSHVAVTAETHTVTSSDEQVAAAQLDADGNIVVTAVSDGIAEIAITTIAAEGETATVVGQFCVEVGEAVTDDCRDADADGECDVCGGDVSCKHVYAEKNVDALGNETHSTYSKCKACSEVLTEAVIEDCADSDADGKCDVCGGDVVCKHADTAPAYTDQGDGTHIKTVSCSACGVEVSSKTETCADDDGNELCDGCGADLSCKHENLSNSYIDNGNGTHEKFDSCTVCGEAQSDAVIENCADEDADGYCDLCEGVMPEDTCDHAETTSETVYNGNKTHTTTVTCVCGEVVSTETADCVDEDKDCACDTCEGVIKTVTLTTVAGSNMNLGNELQVNFIINDPT
ncbi:MAG: hypothetical protein J6J43_02465, partial [Oscillospiraceae bacterium]|nr:hypothetical protein [Oscillospiraceae bacterium]